MTSNIVWMKKGFKTLVLSQHLNLSKATEGVISWCCLSNYCRTLGWLTGWVEMRAVWIGARFICALLPAEEDEQDEEGEETISKKRTSVTFFTMNFHFDQLTRSPYHFRLLRWLLCPCRLCDQFCSMSRLR